MVFASFQERQQIVNNYAIERQKKLELKPINEEETAQKTNRLGLLSLHERIDHCWSWEVRTRLRLSSATSDLTIPIESAMVNSTIMICKHRVGVIPRHVWICHCIYSPPVSKLPKSLLERYLFSWTNGFSIRPTRSILLNVWRSSHGQTSIFTFDELN